MKRPPSIFQLLLTSTPLHLRGKYSFRQAACIWEPVTSGPMVTLQIAYHIFKNKLMLK